MGLNWEGGVTWLAAVADDRPDNETLDQQEHDGGDGEDEVVKSPNLQRLLGNRRQGEGGLAATRNEGNGAQPQQQREFLHG